MVRFESSLGFGLLCWLWSVQITSVASVFDLHVDDVISISVKLRREDSNIIDTLAFEYKVFEPRLEFAVADFCEKSSIYKRNCLMLYADAVRKQKAKQLELLSKDAVIKDKVYVEDIKNIPNEHLKRHPETIQSEVDNHFFHKNVMSNVHELSSYYEHEQRAVDLVISELSTLDTDSLISNRVAFIHSCSVHGNQNYDILQSLIQQIKTHGLIDSLQKVFVLNYGHTIPSHVIAEHSDDRIVFLQVHGGISYFEIPTVRIMQQASTYLTENNLGNTQILYLHTKGVSYTQDYPQIADWRNLMMHFLVEKHVSCYHILASGEFDAVGVNYWRGTFSGNFWWSTALFMSSLPQLSVEKNTKYDSEKWLFMPGNRSFGSKPRVYVPHSSDVDHSRNVYPRYCYVEEELVAIENSLEAFQSFESVCHREHPSTMDFLRANQESLGAANNEAIATENRAAWCMY